MNDAIKLRRQRGPNLKIVLYEGWYSDNMNDVIMLRFCDNVYDMDIHRLVLTTPTNDLCGERFGGP